MKTIIFCLVLSSSIFLLNSCGGSSSISSPQVYSISLTDINISRTSDHLAIPANKLPLAGAEITLN